MPAPGRSWSMPVSGATITATTTAGPFPSAVAVRPASPSAAAGLSPSTPSALSRAPFLAASPISQSGSVTVTATGNSNHFRPWWPPPPSAWAEVARPASASPSAPPSLPIGSATWTSTGEGRNRVDNGGGAAELRRRSDPQRQQRQDHRRADGRRDLGPGDLRPGRGGGGFPSAARLGRRRRLGGRRLGHERHRGRDPRQPSTVPARRASRPAASR